MMEKLKLAIKSERFYIKFLIVIILLLISFWFKEGKLISSGEDGPFLINPERALIVFDNLWIESGTGFSTTDFLPRLPFAYFVFSLFYFGIPSFVIQAITFAILMITGCLSVFYLVKFLNKSSVYVNELAFLSAFFYLFNPFSMTQLWNRQLYSQYFLFALFPLLIYLFVKGLEEKKYKNIFYFSLVSLFFSTSFGLITNVLVIWSVISFYSIYYFLTNKKKVFTVLYLTLTFLTWAVSNLWWIGPFYLNLQTDSVFSSKVNVFENLNTLRALSSYFDIYNLSRLIQDNYFFRDLSLKGFYENYYVQILSFIAPILIVLNSYSIYKDKRLRFFAIIFIIGLFVSLGSNYPFGFIFEFFFTKVTFLQSFRNPYEKYGIVYMLGYVVLLSYSLLYLLESRKSKLVLLLFITFWLYYQTPLISGKRLNINKIENPNHVRKISTRFEEISEKEKNFKVLALPLTGEGVSTIWGYSGVDPSVYLYNQQFVSYRVNTPIQLDFLNKLEEKIVNGNTFELQMALLNSKYIYLKGDLASEKIYTESEITQKKVLDLAKNEIINCKKVSFEKNLIENKKVISCTLENSDFTESFLVKVESPFNISPIEVNIIDSIGNRNIWRNPEQLNNLNLTTTYFINSDKASEKSKLFNYSKINTIYLVIDKNIEIENLNLNSFKFYKTPFKLEKNENNLQRVFSYKDNKIYEIQEFNAPNHFGYVNSIKTVEGLKEIFSLEKISESLSASSIIALNQNKNKFFDANYINYSEKEKTGTKLGISKYWIKNNNSQNELQNIQLLNTFNSQWVILKDTSKEELDGGFLHNFSLIQKSQNNSLNYTHLISNGYANFWQIKNSEDHKGYAVVYLPQIYKEFFIYVSGIFYVFIGIFFMLLRFWKK